MFRLFRSRKLLFLAALAGWRWHRRRRKAPVAFAAGEAGPEGAAHQIRNAGPAAMRDRPRRGWDKVDEQSDESFPASDPPGRY